MENPDSNSKFLKMLDFCLTKLEKPLNCLNTVYNKFYDNKYYPFYEKVVNWIHKHQFCPYLVDFIYSIIRLFLCFSIGVPLAFLLLTLITIVTRYYSISEIVYISIAGPYISVLALTALFFVCSPTIWLYLLDLITFKRVRRRNVELRIIRIQITVVAFRGEGPINYLYYFYKGYPSACYFMYIPLKKEHTPFSSPSKEPPRFYRFGKDFMGREHKSVRFIITKRKSKQIDKLFELVPSAEFEITYYFFSHILKEIHPIEGYEYPEGVKEICDRINKMYP